MKWLAVKEARSCQALREVTRKTEIRRCSYEKDCHRIAKYQTEFPGGRRNGTCLARSSFSIQEGEFVTIMGTSGSGKSTLLNTLGCLDTPTSGEYLLDGVSVRTMSKPQRAVLRNRKIGFVFQNYNLLPKTTAVEMWNFL